MRSCSVAPAGSTGGREGGAGWRICRVGPGGSRNGMVGGAAWVSNAGLTCHDLDSMEVSGLVMAAVSPLRPRRGEEAPDNLTVTGAAGALGPGTR
ncbi:MAG: hypothetical protein LBJ02_00670 [Bifidobacteriaceae bacterium]|nr:hypothetical protein [Bifidobacteriaceae bacterium]